MQITIFNRSPVQTSVCFVIGPCVVQHLLYPPVFPSLDPNRYQFRNERFIGYPMVPGTIPALPRGIRQLTSEECVEIKQHSSW